MKFPSSSSKFAFVLLAGLGRRFAVPASLLVFATACGSSPDVATGEDGPDAGGSGSGGTSTSTGGQLNLGGSNTGGTPDEVDAVCGNGKLEPGELCDDKNTKDGDGCSKDCTEQNADYDCSEPGKPCTDLVICGNGILEGDEACDEGEENETAGCSDDCSAVTDGYSCPRPGFSCVELPVCGNGTRERGEQCDDGQSPPADGDGCDATCQQETGYFCQPGKACEPLVCGNGTRTPDEACDDGDTQGGDGCSASCTVETGYRCGPNGCKTICGDGLILGDEDCDDGNKVSGDGCSTACLEEPYYSCTNAPSTCVTTIVCGNGVIEPGEICDDGASGTGDCIDPPAVNACKAFNIVGVDPAVCNDGVLQYGEECDGDNGVGGCGDDCKVESGYVCPGVNYCYKLPECGDGILQPGEGCDVGGFVNTAACSDCVVQPNYYCSGSEPSVCVASQCGDGVRAPDEQCDDGNVASTDGCSNQCAVETGWVCPAGALCQPVCGDGLLKGAEECEATAPGCINCKVAANYDCGVSGTTCVTTTCGNGTKQRGEGCDDGNKVAGDGCGPTCQVEPTVTVGPSPTVNVTCGDGMKTGTEQCDDGNTANGDGCSASCIEESGWECNETLTLPATVDFQVTIRDYLKRQTAGGHPDFEWNVESPNNMLGPVCTSSNSDACTEAAGTACASGTCARLDAQGKPIFRLANGEGDVRDTDSFATWYRNTLFDQSEDTGIDRTVSGTSYDVLRYAVKDTITLTQQGGTASERYQYTNNSFYPLTGKALGNDGNSTNFHFTTELRYFFQYKGGETLTFTGDDDVWVFVNGRQAVDIGGVHGAENGRVILGDDGDGTGGVDSDCSVHGGGLNTCALTDGEISSDDDKRFGLTKGGVYEIVLFQAERHTSESNFQLTLEGFIAPRSTCTTKCGDGVRAGTELCDAGDSNVDGVYGVCNKSCTYTFCGDGTKNGTEACDNGKNVTVWSTTGTGCAPGCMAPGKCGDGIVQSAFEVCDDGVNNGAYGGCMPGCQALAGYCGDGTKNGTEACDTGPGRVVYGDDPNDCGFDCKFAPHCGDGVRNGDEQCDGGLGCNAQCKLQATCGDGIVQGEEHCDYGSYNSDNPPYGGCSKTCQAGPSCGDGALQSTYEECDDGVNNVDGGYGQCSTSCSFGPHCGDAEVQVSLESCDNGYNEDTYAYVDDACGPGCTAVPYCGDGVVQADFELCDEGIMNENGAYNGCDTTCSWGPYCGDGSIDAPDEDCDDGTGNVSYSASGTGCGYDCRKAPFCGDGVRNGPEQCDKGTMGNDGEYGSCNEDCTLAPRCGDFKVDKSKGEVCDAGPIGSLTCSPTCAARDVIK